MICPDCHSQNSDKNILYAVSRREGSKTACEQTVCAIKWKQYI